MRAQTELQLCAHRRLHLWFSGLDGFVYEAMGEGRAQEIDKGIQTEDLGRKNWWLEWVE